MTETNGDARRSTQSSSDDENRLWISRRAAILGTGVIGAALVTVIGVAAGSGSPIATAPRVAPRATFAVSDDPRGPRPTIRPSEPPPEDTTLDLILRIFIILCVVALIVTIVVLVIRLFLGRGSDLIRRRVLEPDELEMLLTSLTPGVAVPRPTELESALVQGREALLAGADVRAAIITAWLRLEETASAAGTPHLDTDTPTDLVRRLLAQQHVTAPALERLAELYRRARFSPAELLEADRADALRALDDVRHDLDRPAAAATGLVTPRRGTIDDGRWT